MNKTEKVIAAVTRGIRDGILPPGARIASVRNASEDFKVSKNTVIEAYDRLAAQGLIVARRGSGFFVAERQEPIGETEAPPPRHLSEAADRISLLRSQLTQDFSVRVGDGRPPASWMDSSIPARLGNDLFRREAGDRSGYGSAFGHLELRELIAARHRAEQIHITADQVVTTFGANHALDLIIRRYLSPGDCVLVDDPGYYPLFAKLKLAQVRFVGVRRAKNGPDLEDLAAKTARERPRIFFTQSTGHNPTGTSFDLPTAHGVLQIANQARMLVVDDDPFVDLPGRGGIRLAALDQIRSVIFVGSFSKVLSASFRCGYIAAPAEIATDIAELKMITVVNSSRFSEMMIAEMIKSRRYHKHLLKLGKRLDEAKAEYGAKLENLGLDAFSAETDGYYSYLMLPKGRSDLELAKTAGRAGIFIAPSTIFSADESQQDPAIRINITRVNDSRFYNFIRQQIGS
ncbi:PLP-dependent aminotransferase family protein [Denitrobaculum tricleocarpae]|uniref:PLP-dependent aminotransferase family protein n=1 Tax=Denitrobaculum tricleocarpae TaxID=2591009 RepID=A0A545T5J4_9PROT|nr:PLP-dependent aminotransferase family protein [Denitrobaculum tricleocarpae]TQV72438.1 PLP-dependent aminotransferase family protein [Denitrobaculum tricleocarpae]